MHPISKHGVRREGSRTRIPSCDGDRLYKGNAGGVSAFRSYNHCTTSSTVLYSTCSAPNIRQLRHTDSCVTSVASYPSVRPHVFLFFWRSSVQILNPHVTRIKYRIHTTFPFRPSAFEGLDNSNDPGRAVHMHASVTQMNSFTCQLRTSTQGP